MRSCAWEALQMRISRNPSLQWRLLTRMPLPATIILTSSLRRSCQLWRRQGVRPMSLILQSSPMGWRWAWKANINKNSHIIIYTHKANTQNRTVPPAPHPAFLFQPSLWIEGMKYSLPSRDLIANHIELMHEGYRGDALITLGAKP